MSSESVTIWIERLKDGDPIAAQQVWERYFEQLTRYARKKLQAASRRVADEEDAALSAFDSFCRSAQAGRFPKLNDRGDLWQLLVLITARKAADHVHRERAAKRGSGEVRGESVFQGAADAEGVSLGIQQIVGSEPTPEFTAQVADEVQHLLACLPDADLRQIAVWKLEGFTNKEISTKLDCVERSIERRLGVIRSHWKAARCVMPDRASLGNLPPDIARLIDERCLQFEAGCKQGHIPAINEYLVDVPPAAFTLLASYTKHCRANRIPVNMPRFCR